MSLSQDIQRFIPTAHEYGLMEPRVPDLLYQTAWEISKRIRAGDHFRRKATRKADLLSASNHLEGARKALGRIDSATVAAACAPLGARSSILADYAPDDDAVQTLAVDLLPLRLVAIESISRDIEVLHEAFGTLANNETSQGSGRPTVPEPVTFGIHCLAALWARYRPAIPISSSRNRGRFGCFVDSFFLLVQERLADEEQSNENLDSVASGLTCAAVETALRRFLEGEKSSQQQAP